MVVAHDLFEESAWRHVCQQLDSVLRFSFGSWQEVLDASVEPWAVAFEGSQHRQYLLSSQSQATVCLGFFLGLLPRHALHSMHTKSLKLQPSSSSSAKGHTGKHEEHARKHEDLLALSVAFNVCLWSPFSNVWSFVLNPSTLGPLENHLSSTIPIGLWNDGCLVPSRASDKLQPRSQSWNSRVLLTVRFAVCNEDIGKLFEQYVSKPSSAKCKARTHLLNHVLPPRRAVLDHRSLGHAGPMTISNDIFLIRRFFRNLGHNLVTRCSKSKEGLSVYTVLFPTVSVLPVRISNVTWSRSS